MRKFVGKTTIFRKIIPTSDDRIIFWILCEEILDSDNNRIGFQVDYTGNTEPIKFAFKKGDADTMGYQGIDKYTVNQAPWDILAEILTQHKNKIIVIDEIGIMQTIASPSFFSTIESLINDVNVTLFATAHLDCTRSPRIERDQRVDRKQWRGEIQLRVSVSYAPIHT